jgi:YesN/AraC family two-component response regulator
METIAAPIQEISILVVEDEAITLECLVSTLAKKFPSVTLYKALDGITGLEIFKTHTPDIVITDLNMPEISGVQMADKIRKIKPDAKFIVLTGYGYTDNLALQDSERNAFEIDHYIVKPVDFQELFAAIEQCIDEIAQSNAHIGPNRI